jgi:hypothetical protein
VSVTINLFGLLAAIIGLFGGWWLLNRQITHRELDLDHRARLLRIKEKRLTTWSGELDEREQLIKVVEVDQARVAAADELLGRAFGDRRTGDR